MKIQKDKYLELTREIVLQCLDDKNVKVFLFGSRAQNNSKEFSDIDIGFSGFSKPSIVYFRRIREALENSRVPYHFDLVDFDQATENFQQVALQKIVQWN